MKALCLNNIVVTVVLLTFFIGCAPEEEKSVILKEEEGLTSDSTYLFYNNAEYVYQDFPIDSAVEMVFTGLKGFKTVNGKCFIGGSLSVSDSVGEVIFKLDDVFLSLENDGVEMALVNKRVSMVLETGSPMKKGATYTWENVIWDKKSKSRITAKTHIRLI